MKVYRKLTAALLTAILAAAPLCSMPLSAGAVAQTPDAEVLKDYTEIIVNLVNNERAANGLSELTVLPVVCNYAQVRAEEMTILCDHNRPDGRDCFTVMKDDHFFYNVAGENIAAGNPTAAGTFEQWMNSPKHRDNILGGDFTHIGIGYTYDPEGKYRHYWSMFLVGEYDTQSTPVVYSEQYMPERSLGDPNGNHIVNSGDASAILIYAANQSAGLPYKVASGFTKAGDVNSDGVVNAVDASIILSYSAAAGADPNAKLEDFIW